MTGTTQSGRLFLRARLFVDGTGAEPWKDAIISIDGDRIEKIGRAGDFGPPSGARIIDAKNSTIMPGMFDLHTHLGMPEVEDKTKFMLSTSQSLIQYYAIGNCLKTLEAGFTTVRSMGWYPEYDDVALKRAIEAGIVLGPRIFASRRIITQTGGHGELVVPFHEHSGIRFGRVADGADEVRRAAREQLREGADFLKTCSTGGLASGTGPDRLNYTVQELRVIAEEAHAAGKTSAAHSIGLQGVKNAVEAGIDTVEHGFFLDDDVIEMMLKSGTFYVPTLSIVDALSKSPPSVMSEMAVKTARRLIRGARASVNRAHAAGVKIATGTDTIGSPTRHGKNAKELLMLAGAGLTNLEAISAATRISALAVKMERDLGTLEEGKIADILIVDGNPVRDLHVLMYPSMIRMVIKNGRVVVEK